MSDGLQTPPRPDGMACFQNNDGTITLIKNHEIGSRRLPSSYDSNLPKSISYDTNFAGVPYTGGTTNLVLDPKSLKPGFCAKMSKFSPKRFKLGKKSENSGFPLFGGPENRRIPAGGQCQPSRW